MARPSRRSFKNLEYEMYSALNKVYRAFMHTIAVAVFFAVLAVTFATPVEVAAVCGYHWAKRVVAYFWEGGSR